MMAPRKCLLVAVAGVVALIASNSFSPKQAIAEGPDDQVDDPSPIAADGAPKVAAPAKTIDEVFAEIAEKVPGFGGAFLSPDPSERALLVYLIDPKQEKLDELVGVVERDYKGQFAVLDSVDEVRAVQGKYTYIELKNWYDLVREKLVDFDGMIYKDIQEVDNRLEFAVDSKEAQERLLSDLRNLGIPDDAAIVKVAERGAPLAAGEGGLRDYHRGLTGGLEINASTSDCTLGFQAVRNGIVGFLTASHCTANTGYLNSDLVYQPDVATQYRVGTEYVDPGFVSTWQGCSQSRPCRYSDSAFIRMVDGVGIDDGWMARPSPEGSYAWNGQDKLRITAYDSPLANEVVFKVGRTTGMTHGQVYNTCVDLDVPAGGGLSFPVRYLCQSVAVMNFYFGDSGSAVFRCPSAVYPTYNCANLSDITLLGLLHYGAPVGSQAYFSQFPLMQTWEYGTMDVTAPGGK